MGWGGVLAFGDCWGWSRGKGHGDCVERRGEGRRGLDR